MPTPNEQCNTATNHLITNAFFNLTSDIILLSIALPMFIRSRLPMRKKIALVCVFGLGLFVILCAILNKYYSFTEPFGSMWTFWVGQEDVSVARRHSHADPFQSMCARARQRSWLAISLICGHCYVESSSSEGWKVQCLLTTELLISHKSGEMTMHHSVKALIQSLAVNFPTAGIQAPQTLLGKRTQNSIF